MHALIVSLTRIFSGDPHSLPLRVGIVALVVLFALSRTWFATRAQDSTKRSGGGAVALEGDPGTLSLGRYVPPVTNADPRVFEASKTAAEEVTAPLKVPSACPYSATLAAAFPLGFVVFKASLADGRITAYEPLGPVHVLGDWRSSYVRFRSDEAKIVIRDFLVWNTGETLPAMDREELVIPISLRHKSRERADQGGPLALDLLVLDVFPDSAIFALGCHPLAAPSPSERA